MGLPQRMLVRSQEALLLGAPASSVCHNALGVSP